MELFISMLFNSSFDGVFNAISEAAAMKGLKPYRVDKDHLDVPIAVAIDEKIRESRLLIADITDGNPNVMHELGQAQLLRKPVIIISRGPSENASFNTRGSQIYKYDPAELQDLQKELESAFGKVISPNETLRGMLVPNSLGDPTKDSRFVIVVSPLSYRRAMGRPGGFKKIRRTSSDYVGIRGILQGFGSIYGFDTLPDLIDPEDYTNSALSEKMSVYCIASPKANSWTAEILKKYQQDYVPRLEFRADSLSPKLKNINVSIYADDALLSPPGWKLNVEKDRYARDFGLIVRGPNPFCTDHMATIVAGRSSLGTEAACLAITDPTVIAKIRNRLAAREINMEDHKQAFYALASIQRAIGDGKEEAIPSTLQIHQVEKLHKV